jgi:C4-dicarboxylate transporter, DctM subunit
LSSLSPDRPILSAAAGGRIAPRAQPALDRLLDLLEEWLIAALIGAATAITFLAVLHRYGSSNSAALANWAGNHGLDWLAGAADWVYTSLTSINASWAQELATYMFVWMAKFGAALGVRTGIHVGVDVFVNRLTPMARKPVIVLALLCGALFTGIIGTLGAVYVYELDPDQVSPELEWPSWIIYLCIPLGSYLMCFRFLQVTWRYLRTGIVPHQGHGLDYEPPHQIAGVARARSTTASGREPGSWRAMLRPSNATIVAALIVIVPIAITLVCFSERLDVIALPHAVRNALLFALLLALMATGMPISIALGLSVLTYLFILSNVDPKMVGLKLFTSLDRFEIMAVPFFILAGNLLTSGGVARRMIDFATSLIGHWYGGLGLAGVVACALFAAISGSSVATVIGIGSIILPALVEKGYPPRFGAGVIATSGALGILFPPSINLVIYAVATSGMQPRGPAGAVVNSASVGQLFIAGVIPGLMLATMLGTTTWYRAWRHDYPRMTRASWGQCRRAFRDSFWGLFLIVLVLGGIYSGLFTPTEAAAVAAVYAFFIAVFVYKELRLIDVPAVLLKAASMSAMILYIITNAAVFSWLLTSEQIPQSMAEWMTMQGFGTVAFLLVTNVVLLAAGNFMDPAAIVLIMAPILFPMAAVLGVHPVHLGILMAVNMEVGLCHPPVGLNLYVAAGITRMGITELTVAVLPWLGTMLIFLVMVTYIPEISLWLPRALGMLN